MNLKDYIKLELNEQYREETIDILLEDIEREEDIDFTRYVICGLLGGISLKDITVENWKKDFDHYEKMHKYIKHW